MAKTEKRGIPGIVVFLIVAAVVALAVVIGWNVFLNRNLKPMDAKNPQQISVNIPSGAGTQKVSSQLYHAGLIRNSLAFRVRSKKL